MNDRILHYTQDKIDENFKIFGIDRNKKTEIGTTNVSYEELNEELTRLVLLTKNELFIGDKFHSLFIFGPTGVGKTEIISQLAQKHDFIYHKLEVQKVPIEILQGFPYLKDTADGKVAKLAPSTILPPSNHPGNWILHLDEFNKADVDKMAAIMNLVLTGELGGSADFDGEKSIKYRLPRKTLIIGSGNIKSQQNVQNLNMISAMDTATSERWHRTCFLDYNSVSWLSNFAMKPYEFKEQKLSTRIPDIITNFVIDRALDDNNKAAFLMPIVSGSKEGSEVERTTSPRAWTLVADNMILDAFIKVAQMSAEDRKNLEAKTETTALDAYLRNPQNQIDLFSKQVYEFGLDGRQIVKEVISRYIYFSENRIMPDDVVNNYRSIRNRVQAVKDKKGIILYVLLGVGYFIDASKSIDAKMAALNISTYVEDTNISAEDIVAFIHILDYSKNNNAHEVHQNLMDISERYRNSFAGYSYTGAKEISVTKTKKK
jgi:hypothetical protein